MCSPNMNVSHRVPVKSSVHTHPYVFSEVSSHLPPFSHGVATHGTIHNQSHLFFLVHQWMKAHIYLVLFDRMVHCIHQHRYKALFDHSMNMMHYSDMDSMSKDLFHKAHDKTTTSHSPAISASTCSDRFSAVSTSISCHATITDVVSRSWQTSTPILTWITRQTIVYKWSGTSRGSVLEGWKKAIASCTSCLT